MNDSTSEYLAGANRAQLLRFILNYGLIALLAFVPVFCLVRGHQQLLLQSKLT